MKTGPKPLPIAVRFWPKVDKDGPGGCWLWTGSLSGSGYGRFWDGTRFSAKGNNVGSQAHRVAYELLVGPIPEGLFLDHLCRNPPCVNPAHLEPVTHAENMRRGAWGMKTHCTRGHPFDEANTYTAKDGHRVCRACHALFMRAKRQAIVDLIASGRFDLTCAIESCHKPRHGCGLCQVHYKAQRKQAVLDAITAAAPF